MPPSRRVSSDLFLILTSLAIAFVVWLIAKEGDLGQETFDVPLRLVNVPANVEAQLPFTSVRLVTSEPKSVGAQLSSGYFAVELDWEDLPDPRGWCGTRQPQESKAIALDPGSRQVALSGGISPAVAQQIRRHVQFLAIEPPTVRVQGRYVTRPARIVPKTRGAVVDGFELDGPIVLTNADREILLTASPEVFARLGAAETSAPVTVPTEEIDLADRRDTFFSEPLALVLPEGVETVNREEARVVVKVTIKEKRITRTVEGVPVVIASQGNRLDVVYDVRTVDVTVEGPERAVKPLQAADLVAHPAATLNEAADAEVTAKLTAALADTASPDLRDAGIVIRSTKPDSIQVKFRARVRVPLPGLNE